MIAARRQLAELKGWLFVGPALIWTAAFFVVPFAVMAAVSLSEQGGSGDAGRSWTLAHYATFFEHGQFREALQNSVEIAVISTLVSVLIAYPLAWIIAERVPKHLQRYALILAVIPFWTSYVVRSYAWLLVLARHGIVNEALLAAGLIGQPLDLANTRTATVIGFVHFFVMLLTLTIYANLAQLPPNYRRAAADLGAGAIRTFLYVILPLTLPGIMVGAFLSFVLCIGDYITPQILGGSIEIVMPQFIMLQVTRRADFSTASALSIVLMFIVTLAYLACARWLKLERA
jgi:spermidine/putrescine transport system permease protein